MLPYHIDLLMLVGLVACYGLESADVGERLAGRGNLFYHFPAPAHVGIGPHDMLRAGSDRRLVATLASARGAGPAQPG